MLSTLRGRGRRRNEIWQSKRSENSKSLSKRVTWPIHPSICSLKASATMVSICTNSKGEPLHPSEPSSPCYLNTLGAMCMPHTILQRDFRQAFWGWPRFNGYRSKCRCSQSSCQMTIYSQSIRRQYPMEIAWKSKMCTLMPWEISFRSGVASD